MSNCPRLMVAGTQSGVGKTTITTGIMAALKKRDLTVQPFKVGPDYIDPSYHYVATGLHSRNLDSWLIPHDALVELFFRVGTKSDICLIEGVMGLYDGHSGLDDSGSTAEVAKLLGCPVVLIIDASRMARSAAAIALGYVRFDPELNLAGFIINNIGSERHYLWVKEAIEQVTALPVLGYLPRNIEFEMPERHLGLIPTFENVKAQFIEPLCVQIEKTIDIEQLRKIASSIKSIPKPDSTIFPSERVSSSVNIAYAWDEAFSFYYQDTLDLLEAYGAVLMPFSPMNDFNLPPDVHGMYIGGGFPEIYAEQLSQNHSMMKSIREAAERGIPIYGECGGLMYLSEGITDFEGKRFEMAGLVPGWSVMKNRLTRMGYVEIEILEDTVIASKGTQLRGHEFHWSEMENELAPPAYQINLPDRRLEGYARGNILASYVHLHFGADSRLAQSFVEVSRRQL